jgi:hypothetical protein
MCPQLQSSNVACQWEQGSGWLRHQLAACAAGCRQIDCLALSYLEVLQAAPLAELTVPGIAAAAEAAPATFHSLVDIDAEPQCRRLARLFAVPALQPLLLANGGVEALLAGATRLLVRTGASTLCMPSAAAQQHSTASAVWTATDNRAAALCHDVFVSAPMRLPPLPCVHMRRLWVTTLAALNASVQTLAAGQWTACCTPAAPAQRWPAPWVQTRRCCACCQAALPRCRTSCR